MPKKSIIGDVIIELTNIDSTNNYAMRLINEGMAEHGVVVRADFQTAGKGQLGNTWQAEESKNLLMSVILDTRAFQIENQFYLNAAACLSVADTMMHTYNVRDVSIKWPNDIYAGNRKLAGILIENNIRGNSWSNAVIGIGLNVNQTQFADLNRATSLALEVQKPLKVSHIMKQVLKSFNHYFGVLSTEQDAVLRSFNKLLMGVDTQIAFTKNYELQEGILLGVDSYGLLEIKQGTKLKKFKHKEIEQVIG
jgi:BirA family biotin operon repressor/biotin-[acetyl-CoA-carboxylase] ligase